MNTESSCSLNRRQGINDQSLSLSKIRHQRFLMKQNYLKFSYQNSSYFFSRFVIDDQQVQHKVTS